MEELTNTMQLLFSSGDEQSGNDFHCPERLYSAGIQPDSSTRATFYQTYIVPCTFEANYCARVLSQVCSLSLHMSACSICVLSLFVRPYLCLHGHVCVDSVGAGNQEGTVDP